MRSTSANNCGVNNGFANDRVRRRPLLQRLPNPVRVEHHVESRDVGVRRTEVHQHGPDGGEQLLAVADVEVTSREHLQ